MEMHAFLFPWNGRKATLYFLIDITGRKGYEAQLKASIDEKSVLLMEIHHRVKNNLQIISGLLNLQSLYAGNPQIVHHLRECENRIMAMAMVHESLYQSSNLARITARDHIKNLAAALLSSESTGAHIQLETAIEDISLDLDTAIPCSLIVNELVTNAIKYAFAGRQEGTLRIALSRDGDGMLTLSVGDDGSGLPHDHDINSTDSLGMKLVRRLVTSQLKGTLEIVSENGTTFVMRFSETRG